VRCLVEDLELSLSDTARAAGVSPAAASQWVSGKNAHTTDKLERPYTALGEMMERCLPEPPHQPAGHSTSHINRRQGPYV